MNMEFVWSDWGALPEAAHHIRTTVFMQEQGFVEEFDARDGSSYHVLLRMDGAPCGTARLFWDDEPRVARLGRLALLKPARGGGYGRALLYACCDKARALGASRMVLDAQMRAKEFYLACGFEVCGDMFIAEDYPHWRMEYDLTKRG